jgi:hypothetical protein
LNGYIRIAGLVRKNKGANKARSSFNDYHVTTLRHVYCRLEIPRSRNNNGLSPCAIDDSKDQNKKNKADESASGY